MSDPRGNILKYLGVDYAFAPTYVRDRAPLVTDIQDDVGFYKIPSVWVHETGNNPIDNDVYILVDLSSVTGILEATWLLFTGGGGGAVTKLRADDGNIAEPIVGLIDVDGNTVPNGTNATPAFTRANIPNTLDIDIQLAADVTAPGTINDVGLAMFDDTQFTVTNGLVQLIGGGLAFDQITVDDFTAPGTNPVLPDPVTGNVNISASLVAAHSIPIETHSRAANSFNIEPQISSAAAMSTLSENGLCHFDSSRFSVDVDGFVTSVGMASFVWIVEPDATRNLLVFQGVFGNRPTAQTFTLPAVSAVGDEIRVVQMGAGNITIDYSTNQLIHFGNTDSTVTTGSIVSSDVGDSVYLVCNVANLEWFLISAVGNWNVV